MEVLVPSSIDEALAILGEHPDSLPLAGGTDLMVDLNFGRARPRRVMSLRRLADLRELHAEGGRLRCGAGVTYTRLLAELDDAAMVQAARTVGSPQIRNAGTLGGNLGTCSPAGDLLPVLAALDADVVLASRGDERRVPFTDFMHGPKRSARRSDELIVAAEWEAAGHAQAFLKAGTRNAMVIAVLRERLGLFGSTKAGEQGECGSCSVLVDRTLVCSCLVLAAAVDGAEVTSIEGLSGDPVARAVQDALVEAGGVQCGFCTPGF